MIELEALRMDRNISLSSRVLCRFPFEVLGVLGEMGRTQELSSSVRVTVVWAVIMVLGL